MKTKRGIAMLLVMITIFSLLPFESFAISNETEFYKYLTDIGTPTKSRMGRAANFQTYKKYGLVVYGGPKDIANNDYEYSKKYGTYEYRYLGYKYDDRLNNINYYITNERFPDDERYDKSPEQWKYVDVKYAEDYWRCFNSS